MPKKCSNATCLQRCRSQCWSILIRLAIVESETCEIPRNSLKIQTYRVQGHRSWRQSKAHMQLAISHLKVSVDVSPTVFEILTYVATK